MPTDLRCKVPTVVANAQSGFKGGSGDGFVFCDIRTGSGGRILYD